MVTSLTQPKMVTFLTQPKRGRKESSKSISPQKRKSAAESANKNNSDLIGSLKSHSHNSSKYIRKKGVVKYRQKGRELARRMSDDPVLVKAVPELENLFTFLASDCLPETQQDLGMDLWRRAASIIYGNVIDYFRGETSSISIPSQYEKLKTFFPGGVVKEVDGNGAWIVSFEKNKERFTELSQTWYDYWKNEASSLEDLFTYPAYVEIINMGRPALPLILNELKKQSSHWFFALEKITGVNPIREDQAGKINEMAKAWIDWGVSEKIIE